MTKWFFAEASTWYDLAIHSFLFFLPFFASWPISMAGGGMSMRPAFFLWRTLPGAAQGLVLLCSGAGLKAEGGMRFTFPPYD
jgi:hypothetical protein